MIFLRQPVQFKRSEGGGTEVNLPKSLITFIRYAMSFDVYKKFKAEIVRR